jgi:catechol 2,3-dioxygenase-like lactoylglutathione lyase family enzyme
MTMHIGHVALRVTDLPRSVDHVTRVLGLTETSSS